MLGSEHKLSSQHAQVYQRCTDSADFAAGIDAARIASNPAPRGGPERAISLPGGLRLEGIPVEKGGLASDFCEYRYSLLKSLGHIRYARLFVPAGLGASGKYSINICPNSGLGYRC
jgi:hypothetical protein